MTPADETPEISAQLREILDARGVHAFLKALNSRVPHRFTGIYRFEDPILRNVRLFDIRHQPPPLDFVPPRLAVAPSRRPPSGGGAMVSKAGGDGGIRTLGKGIPPTAV